MTEHVHEWYGDDQGAVCGVDSCEETLSQKETNRRLNATERLSGLDARIMGSVGSAGLKDKALEMLLAYAVALEDPDGK